MKNHNIKLKQTPMMTQYMIKLLIRIVIFLSILFLYLFNKELMYELMLQPIWHGISPLHLLWLMFMVMMITHLFPDKLKTMALRKSKKTTYDPVENYSQTELFAFISNQNVKAWRVMLLWLAFNSIFGILYLFDIMDNADLLMLTVFYFLCDYICILFYCPFQSFIMKNKCCVNCRIYDWGHFMMFTPMLFIRNFYSWSLFFVSCVVLIHWEIIYAKHPERFYSGSNKRLQCINCRDKTCQIKKTLSGQS